MRAAHLVSLREAAVIARRDCTLYRSLILSQSGCSWVGEGLASRSGGPWWEGLPGQPDGWLEQGSRRETRRLQVCDCDKCAMQQGWSITGHLSGRVRATGPAA